MSPVTESGATSATVTLPKGALWYNYFNGKSMESGAQHTGNYIFSNYLLTCKIIIQFLVYNLKNNIQIILLNSVSATLDEPTPVYQKGGTIIPTLQRVRRSTKIMMNDPYTLIVALDENGAAKGYLYMYDGQSFKVSQIWVLT